jgi:hypothetical protein
MLLWSAAWLTLSEIANRGRNSQESEQEISPFSTGKNSYLRFPERQFRKQAHLSHDGDCAFAPEGGGHVHPRLFEMTPTAQSVFECLVRAAARVGYRCRLRSTPTSSKPARQPSPLSRRRRVSLIAVTLMLGCHVLDLTGIRVATKPRRVRRAASCASRLTTSGPR